MVSLLLKFRTFIASSYKPMGNRRTHTHTFSFYSAIASFATKWENISITSFELGKIAFWRTSFVYTLYNVLVWFTQYLRSVFSSLKCIYLTTFNNNVKPNKYWSNFFSNTSVFLFHFLQAKLPKSDRTIGANLGMLTWMGTERFVQPFS